MAARFEDSRSFDATLPSIAAAIGDALRGMRADAVDWSADRRRVTAWIGVNLWSWGERLAVVIDNGGRVHVCSTCRFPLQIIDWGKNRRNCHGLLATIARQLESEEPTSHL